MKKTPFSFLFNIGIVIVFISFLVFNSPAFAQGTCLNLSSDLYFGIKDSDGNHAVLDLQNYLTSLGHLSAKPNGYFGKATLAAVKKYQTANGITVNGRVGPLTRATINKKTCTVSVQKPFIIATSTISNPTNSTSSGNTTTTIIPSGQSQSPVVIIPPGAASTSGTTPTTIPSTTRAAEPPAPNITVTSPVVGQILAIGSSTVIRWNNASSGSFNIILEQPGGVGAGFIAMSPVINTNSNQYIWSVGKVFSSQSNTNQTVPAGTYRIRLQSQYFGASQTDGTSGWFTITAPQFNVSSVNPSSAPADNTSSVVIFGSGLTMSASVYFDSNYSSLRGNNSYVSPDGTILVFTIPTNVPSGPHTLWVNNGSGQSASLSMVVSAIR